MSVLAQYSVSPLKIPAARSDLHRGQISGSTVFPSSDAKQAYFRMPRVTGTKPANQVNLVNHSYAALRGRQTGDYLMLEYIEGNPLKGPAPAADVPAHAVRSLLEHRTGATCATAHELMAEAARNAASLVAWGELIARFLALSKSRFSATISQHERQGLASLVRKP